MEFKITSSDTNDLSWITFNKERAKSNIILELHPPLSISGVQAAFTFTLADNYEPSPKKRTFTVIINVLDLELEEESESSINVEELMREQELEVSQIPAPKAKVYPIDSRGLIIIIFDSIVILPEILSVLSRRVLESESEALDQLFTIEYIPSDETRFNGED